MGAFNADLIKYDDFISGALDGLLESATFTARSMGKRKSIEVCDLIITADTETSKYKIDSELEYFAPAELEYLTGMHIKVSDALKRDFNDYAYIKRKAFGVRLYLGEKGYDVEEVYSELIRLYGWERLLNRADMLQAIIDFLFEEKIKKSEYEKSIEEESYVGWVYQWCICIYDGEPHYIYGRKPSDMCACFKHIADVLKLDDIRKASVYFHNFAYDYQYLKKFILESIDKDFDPEDEYRMLATAPHKIISYQTTSGIVFKCSYRLSNASLDFWSRKMMFTKHKKLVGAVDYDVIRFQDSPLTRDDWRYMLYDCLVVAECLEESLKRENHTLASIPLTSTGYVRNDARHNSKKDKKARKEFEKAALGERGYKVFKAAQAGGYTHTNRFIAGETVTPPKGWGIYHFDMRSFYPSEQMVETYPISKFICYKKKPGKEEVNVYLSDTRHKYIFVVSLVNGRLNDGEVFPYISSSKALKGKVTNLDLIEDNGRVLEAKGTYILCLTELDFKIILEQYKFKKVYVLEVWRARAGYLPGWMRDTINKYYKDKSDYKQKSKLYPENTEYKALLMKSKNKLNGIYGMTATDIVRASFFETNDGGWIQKEPDIKSELDKYYRNKNNFMWLQWGVWCTSWARYRLFEEAKNIGWEHILYADTDSLFFVGDKHILNGIERRNKKKEKNALKIGAFITMDDGTVVTYDAFEDEKEKIIKFRALHSKCYAYITDDGKLHATVAGVATRGRAEELGDIENLKNGFVFKKCGGTTIKYVEDEISHADIDGHRIEYASAAIILNTEKTIKHEPWEYAPEYKYLTMEELKND